MTEENLMREEELKEIRSLTNTFDIITSIMRLQPGTTIFMGKLLSQMMNGAHRGQFYSKDQLKTQIITISKALPHRLRLIDHKEGTLVKINKQ
jgi:hypothetical protein